MWCVTFELGLLFLFSVFPGIFSAVSTGKWGFFEFYKLKASRIIFSERLKWPNANHDFCTKLLRKQETTTFKFKQDHQRFMFNTSNKAKTLLKRLYYMQFKYRKSAFLKEKVCHVSVFKTNMARETSGCLVFCTII